MNRDVAVTESLVRDLLRSQAPAWAELPLRAVESAGTDHALFRLGEDLVVRLPRVDRAVGQAEKEARWLPVLAPSLPLPIPEPLWLGTAGDDFPWPWSVYRWLPGVTPAREAIETSVEAARSLGRFLIALRGAEPTGGPTAGAPTLYRAVPLARLDRRVRSALDALQGRVDVDGASSAWRRAMDAPPHMAAPAWAHGDPHAGNLLASGGRISAVIDFGLLGVGDPAVDLMAGWTIFSGEAREVFRSEARADDAAWRRGRGWALYSAVIALPYYWETNAQLVAGCLRTLEQVLADDVRGA